MLCSTEIKQRIDDQGGLNLPSYFRLEATMGNGVSGRTDSCLQGRKAYEAAQCSSNVQKGASNGMKIRSAVIRHKNISGIGFILCLLIGFPVPCTHQLLRSCTGDTT